MEKKWKKNLWTIIGVLAGNLILAFTVSAFMVPHGIIMGGATGMGLTISHYFPIDLSLIIFIVNAILFVLGAVVLGKKFALTTIISTFVYPTFLSVVRQIPGVADMTDNIMLATIYGGALLGLGIGLIVRVGASGAGIQQMVSYSSGSAFVCCRFYSAWNAGILFKLRTDSVWYSCADSNDNCAEPRDADGTVSDSVIYYHGAL